LVCFDVGLFEVLRLASAFLHVGMIFSAALFVLIFLQMFKSLVSDSIILRRLLFGFYALYVLQGGNQRTFRDAALAGSKDSQLFKNTSTP
jgi:hypothetical protein